MRELSGEHFLPFIAFCVLPDDFISLSKEFFHVPCQYKKVKYLPENAKRTSEMKDVSHDSCIALTFEDMLVMDKFERTFDLFIDKVKWRFESSNFRCKLLPDTKMSCFPGDRFT